MQTHYSQEYFSWQIKAGLYGASQDLWKFQPFISKNDSVLDFGCGGGYILERLDCKKKYGVDINFHARNEAEKRGIHTCAAISDIPKKVKFDVIISHHSLEHVSNPSEIIRQLRQHMKSNGIGIHIVPIDDWRTQKKYTQKDINKHLYTWTPLLLGNLFAQEGYEVKSVEIINHAWLPLSRFYFQYIPSTLYYFLSSLWSKIILSRQLRIVVAKK